jgi:acyl carrier protein
MQQQAAATEIFEILWQSLRGGNYDLDELRVKLSPDSRFDEAGIDSLDMTDFFIRIEERYQVKILQEDYPNLASVRSLQGYLEGANRTTPGLPA